MDLKSLCWNVQRCGDSRFLLAAKQILHDNKPDLLVFNEPHISGSKADYVISTVGFPNLNRTEASGSFGSIWVAWYDTIFVTILMHHFQFVHCRTTLRSNNSSFLATAVYASPSASRRKLLWPHLRRLVTSINSTWILFGDFNATLFDSDRKIYAISARPFSAFQNLIFDYGLRDINYQAPDYTWSRGHSQVRLDRFIYNNYWDENFAEAMVHHLHQSCEYLE
ncbi:uncharacterized protein LOC120204792 [Hibiscus syriacus]|uniref:uncharacterized protein LOC120204792 n=1 Tax=Hibiscus syriacus TaxID=106335 RepID=UPI0019241C50|nr:uncharacterized protein LOC120204792 [Hibiscus syriacus]